MEARFKSSLLTTGQNAEISALLDSFSLPVEDLNDDHLLLFKVTRNDLPIGCFGLELLGSSGLVRSVALFPEYHGQGLGKQMIRMAFDQARSRGITDLYLLTTDQETFFAKMGFTRVAKEQLPAAIKKTREFLELCPDSAVSMRSILSKN